MAQTFFTIFTSVYNRKHTIHRVWDSLRHQTYKNFEWIIINNGSVDDIDELLVEYKNLADFKVRIFNQQNMGKYLAFDRAIDLADGELMIPADSDDSFDYNTLKRFKDIWNEYKKDDISGITVLCRNEDGSIVGDKFPIEGISCFEEMEYKYKVKGEKWGCVRTDILKKYRFPKRFDVKYFPDRYVWAQIGFNYKTVFVNETLRLYFQDAGNQITNEKNVSKEFMRMKNFFTMWRINYIFPRVRKYISLHEFVRTYMFMWITAFRSEKPVLSVLTEINLIRGKILAFFLLIPAYCVFKLGN